MVFAGFGVSAPELSHDDYAGRDVRGKVVVLLSNAPSRFPSEQRAHHASRRRKAELAAAKGAVGVIVVRTREDERVTPWARMLVNLDTAAVAWLTRGGVPADVPEGIQGAAMLSSAGAATLFEGSPVAPRHRARRSREGRAEGLRSAGRRHADQPQHAPSVLERQRGGEAPGCRRDAGQDGRGLLGASRSRRHRQRRGGRHDLQRRL